MKIELKLFSVTFSPLAPGMDIVPISFIISSEISSVARAHTSTTRLYRSPSVMTPSW